MICRPNLKALSRTPKALPRRPLPTAAAAVLPAFQAAGNKTINNQTKKSHKKNKTSSKTKKAKKEKSSKTDKKRKLPQSDKKRRIVNNRQQTWRKRKATVDAGLLKSGGAKETKCPSHRPQDDPRDECPDGNARKAAT